MVMILNVMCESKRSALKYHKRSLMNDQFRSITYTWKLNDSVVESDADIVNCIFMTIDCLQVLGTSLYQ